MKRDPAQIELEREYIEYMCGKRAPQVRKEELAILEDLRLFARRYVGIFVVESDSSSAII